MIDLAIIGGGPAGLSAGLYATRGGIKNAVLFDKGAPGGQITGSSEIENYPGVSEVKTGLDFMEPWLEQCFRFGLRHELSLVTRVSVDGNIFRIHKDDGSFSEARSVIVSTGGRPKRCGVKGESEFWGRGVSTCATCDAFFHKGREVAVLGGGDTALEEAVYLTKFASRVHLLHRRDFFRAAPLTVERAKGNEKINFMIPYGVEEIHGDGSGVTSVDVRNLSTNEITKLNVGVIFVFVGYEVNNSVLVQEDGSMLCECDEYGSIKVDSKMHTSVKGLFAAGDIRSDAPKQVVCAAGDGALAGIEAVHYIDSNR